MALRLRSTFPAVLPLLLSMAGVAAACGGAPVCTVKDPTGTPLNIRTGPNERIVGTAANGTELEFIDHVEHNGSLWARVARFDPDADVLTMEAGILFLNYLDCDQELVPGTYEEAVACVVADPTGTPLNIRVEPNGDIMGTVRNGETVRVYRVMEDKGKLWAEAWRDPSDNAVGWVFDAYLKCEEDEGH